MTCSSSSLPQAPDHGFTTPESLSRQAEDADHHFGARLKSMEQRMAAMGGIPALGSATLPRASDSRQGMRATSSPAAVEMLRGRLDDSAAGPSPLRHTTSSSAAEEEPENSTPLVQLRKVTLNDSGSGSRPPGATPAVGPAGLAGPGSELAAALQRRAQKAGAGGDGGSKEA